MSAARLRQRLRVADALLLTSGIWFLAKFVRYAFPPLFETFQGQYGVSPATLGALFSVLMLAYAAMQFPSGALSDRFGTVGVVSAGATGLAACATVLAITQAFWVLVAAMVGIGLATGVHKTAAITLLGRAYPARTGRTLGTMDAIGSAGGVAAPAAVVLALSTPAGWPVVFLAIGLASAVFAVGFRRFAPRRLPEAPARRTAADRASESTGLAGYLAAFRAPRVAGFGLVVIAYAFAFNGVVAFLPLYLVAVRGLSTAQAGLLYAVLFAVSLVQPLTGDLADRIGRYPLLVGGLALASGALTGLLFSTSVPVMGGLVALMGLGGHGFRPVRDAHLVAILPTAAAGGTLGLLRTAMMGAGAVAPAVVGALASMASYRVAFGLLAGVLVGGTLVVAGLAIADQAAATYTTEPR